MGDRRWRLAFALHLHSVSTRLLGHPLPLPQKGNHDYSGLLSSQVNFGERAPHPFGDDFDKRWRAPDLRFTWTERMGDATDPRACVAFVALDTCPLMDNYRQTAGSNTGDPSRGARNSLRGLFIEQINNGESPASQMSWFAQQLRNASKSCAAVVVTGHASVFSRGQHGQAARQQDLRTRLNFPTAFAWAGVDAYLNGHDHIVELVSGRGEGGAAAETLGSRSRPPPPRAQVP